jgi:hypothetical protein
VSTRKTPTIAWSSEARLLAVIAALLLGLGLGGVPRPEAQAATPGLPFVEDFADTSLRDSSLTNANWSTAEQALVLNGRRAHYGVFGGGTHRQRRHHRCPQH